METKYLIRSIATGEYFARLVGHRQVMHWTEFPLLARKFDGESVAILHAESMALPVGTYKIASHAFKTEPMPDATDLARFADQDRRGVTGV